ncbi:MAG: cytochrome P450 [Polyangiales bacterium]
MLPLAPGPKPLPLVGHIPWMLRDAPAFLRSLTQRYGDVVSFKLGPRQCVLVNHPTLIERIVRDRTSLRSSETRRALSSLLGDGLLSIEGTPHLRHRRLMAPAFHRERIRSYGQQMSEETYAFMADWQGGQVRDLRDDMMRLTFMIVSRSLFSADTRQDAQDVGRALEEAIPWTLRGARLAGFLPERLPILYPPRARAAINRLNRVVTDIVTRRRREGGDQGDLLSMLLATRDEDGSALSDEDVAAESLTLLLAGHDTTANTLSWAWHLLTQHPEIQQALGEEVQRVVGDRPVTPDDLPQLTLTDQIVRETLRLYPTAWVGDRVPQSDIELGGYRIPANTLVMFSVYVTQRDARFFPDPDRFDPSRFSPERVGSIMEGAYLPFGAGVHMCIGNAFAMMEARIILAAMAQRFSIRAAPGHRVEPRPLITLGMADAFPVVLRRREPRKGRDDVVGDATAAQ